MCAGTKTEGISNILYQLPAIYIYISTNRVADSHTDNNTSSTKFLGILGFSIMQKQKQTLYPTRPVLMYHCNTGACTGPQKTACNT